MKTSNVSYLVKKGIGSVWKNFIMSFASFCILLVSLLQVSITVLFMLNINIIMKNIENTNEITIFVEKGATEEQKNHIKSVLESDGNLTDIVYKSAEEARKEFEESMGEASDLFDYLEENPMPETFLARVNDLRKIKYSVESIASIDGVEQVKAPYDFAAALINIRNTFSIIIIAILVTLVAVSVVVVSNTIRTSVFARREEISIMKYVGATNGFIKLPFFVEGMFIGVLAGGAAFGLTWFIYNSVFSLFSAENFSLWQMFGFFNLIPFENIMWIVLGANCLAGALLGAIGTVVSTGKYLKV